MRDYPMLTPEKRSRDFIDVFGGYNHNPRIQDNEFYEMKNMTGSYYPLLATRDKRGEVPEEICDGAGQSADYVRGMLYRSALYYVVYQYDESTQTVTVPFALRKYADGVDEEIKAFDSGYLNSHDKRNLIMMGAYMIILPDKLYVNVENPEDSGSIEAEVTTATNETVSIMPCLADGRPIVIKYVGPNVPSDYYDGYVWVDTSEKAAQIKYYDAENNVWIPVVSQYIGFFAENTEISADFKEGDGINISGVPDEITEEAINYNGTSILRLKPDDKSIVLSGSFKSTLLVFDPIIQLTQTQIKVFCARPVVANQYKDKTFLIRDIKKVCTANTAATEYKIYEKRDINVSSAQATCFTTINKKQTFSVTSTWRKIKVVLHNNVGESLFDNVEADDTLYVRIGNNDTSSRNVWEYRHHSTGTAPFTEDEDEISLRYAGDAGYSTDESFRPFEDHGTFSIPAGTKIYPIQLGDSKGLYETKFTFNNSMKVFDKICLDPEYKIECAEPLTFARKMPLMDHVIESKNRLWGCRYGENNDGEIVNEIYASKLGDFKNWQVYNGASTDSYAATCGTDGKWTGAVNFLGYPTFFKENYIHTVYGSYPAQYQINSVTARGVQEGSSDSLAMVNEVLFYKTALGICAYTGSLPSHISSALGDIRYHDAIACAYNGKYYVCMKDDDDDPYFFVYDATKNLWHKEDELYVDQFCPVKDDIYYISSSGQLKSLFGSGGQDSEDTVWSFVTGEFGLSTPDHKYVSRVNIRLSNAKNIEVFISYDNNPAWERIYEIRNRNSLQPYTVRIKPKRCDRFRLRLVGTGQVKIYSISKTIEQGSDVNIISGRVE